MRVNIYICLFALVLGCNVTAEIIHQIVEEKNLVSLRCSHSVEGKLTWSREINGSTVDIFIVDGDREQRFNDPHKRYGSTVDKSLAISRVAVSDSGKYLCNNEAAVELTVIPSGTIIQNATERTEVILKCLHDDAGSGLTWTRKLNGEMTVVGRHEEEEHTQDQSRIRSSDEGESLVIQDVQLGDSGLYYCGDRPAVYLNVIKGTKQIATERTKVILKCPHDDAGSDLTWTRKLNGEMTVVGRHGKEEEHTQDQSRIHSPDKGKSLVIQDVQLGDSGLYYCGDRPAVYLNVIKAPKEWLVVTLSVILLLVVIIIIIFFTWRCRFRRQGSGEQTVETVYAEMLDGSVFDPAQGESNQPECTYFIPHDLPAPRNNTVTPPPNETLYSLINEH